TGGCLITAQIRASRRELTGRTRRLSLAWTRITDPERATEVLPVWFSIRMIGLRGSFGLLLTTGDVLRITTVTAMHESARGVILLDVLLDTAGVPEGVD